MAIFILICCIQVANVIAASNKELLSDSGGSIQTAVISVNSARRAALRNAALITNIVNALPSSVQVYILTNDLPAFTVARNPWPDRIHFLSLPADNPITIWTQDPFVVLKGSDNSTTLLTPKDFQRADDRLMAHKLADINGYDLEESEMYFEGGNIVSDENFVFVGANTIRLNAIKLELSEKEVVVKLENELGRKILVIGPFPQPVSHIDMILTPIGNKRLVLADANQGVRIAEKATRENLKSVQAFETYCETHFFGNPGIVELNIRDGQKLVPPRISGQTIKMVELSKKSAPILDGIAESLEQYGYQVYRVPFLFGGPESKQQDKGSDKLVSKAAYPMLTYNNVLLERDEDKQIVYLPQYEWLEMDKAAVKSWQDIGFNVHPIKELTISAMYGGSLRCSVKVLEKKRYP